MSKEHQMNTPPNAQTSTVTDPTDGERQRAEGSQVMSRRKMLGIIAGITGGAVLAGAGVGAGYYYSQYDWDFTEGNEALKYYLEHGEFPPRKKFIPPTPKTYTEDEAKGEKAEETTKEQASRYAPDAKVTIPKEYAGVDTGYEPITGIQGLVAPGSYTQRTDTRNNARMSLSIPAYNIWVGLVKMGNINGQIQIARSGEATYYDQSAPIGSSKGTTLIAGHVNYSNAAPTVLWRLGSVAPGTLVYATGEDGHTHTYRALRIDQYHKSGLPGSFFTREGEPLLRILTCSGLQMTANGWEFVDNIVLTCSKLT